MPVAEKPWQTTSQHCILKDIDRLMLLDAGPGRIKRRVTILAKGTTKQTTQDLIQEMVSRIVTQFHPDKIILFGSHARGTAGPDSDVDLLVVMPVKGSKRLVRLQIRSALHDIRLAKDVLVSDPAEFEWRKDVVGTIEWPAVHEGRVLYAKA